MKSVVQYTLLSLTISIASSQSIYAQTKAISKPIVATTNTNKSIAKGLGWTAASTWFTGMTLLQILSMIAYSKKAYEAIAQKKAFNQKLNILVLANGIVASTALACLTAQKAKQAFKGQQQPVRLRRVTQKELKDVASELNKPVVAQVQ